MDTKIKPPLYVSTPQKKRVLFVITQSELGGAQRFLNDFITHLDRAKYEPILAVGQDGDGALTALLQGKATLHILQKLRREISLFEDLAAVRELRRLIKKTKPDVLFLNSSKAGFIGAAAAVFPYHIRNLKVIYRIGGWTFNDPWPSWKKKLWITLEKISARWKDIIIVNNQHDFRQAQDLNIRPKEKLLMIHNGLDVYKTTLLPREEARLKLFEKIAKYAGKIFHTKTIIGTIANFYPTKGLRYFISAAEAFRDNEEVAFVIFGDGQERAELEKLIAEKRLQKKVFLMGRVPRASEFLTAFDIFVLSSVKEGFPWAVLEAMAAKVPVIATSVGAVPEIIEDGKNGLIVDPKRSAQISAKISEILSNHRLSHDLGINGHQTVLFKFSLDKMTKRTEELF
ncbi:MAG: glycosyltransferase [bacterium]|nr:glycosyltransferase [bacterium]